MVTARVAVAFLVLASAAVALAKDFAPGDIRLCGTDRCAAVMDPDVANEFADFIYGEDHVRVVRPPRANEPAFELKTSDGLAMGRVSGKRLNRALVYGLYCGRFKRGRWYLVPPRIASELRRLAHRLHAERAGRRIPPSC